LSTKVINKLEKRAKLGEKVDAGNPS
jgi:hypothetical protein